MMVARPTTHKFSFICMVEILDLFSTEIVRDATDILEAQGECSSRLNSRLQKLLIVIGTVMR